MTQYLAADFPLPKDPEHGLAVNQVENETWIRCPFGCDRIWNKITDTYDSMVLHMTGHEMDHIEDVVD